MVIVKRRSLVLPLALAFGALGMMTAPIAGATHPQPKGATPLYVPLVPAYEPCGTPNRQHGPPLAFPSCNPPMHSSAFLTVGTPDANGAAANSIGFIQFRVFAGAPGPPSDTEVLITFQVTDVRCKAGVSACGNANATGGSDYVGELEGNAMIRITDHWNATSAGGGTDPATVVDIPVPVIAYCSNTADTSIGGSCTVDTSAGPMIPDPCNCEARRMVVEFTHIRVSDGGSDGLVSTSGNTPFLTQGLFIP